MSLADDVVAALAEIGGDVNSLLASLRAGIWVDGGASISAGGHVGVNTATNTVTTTVGTTDYTTAVVTLADGTADNELTILKARGPNYMRLDGKINGDENAQVIVNAEGASVLALWDDVTNSHWISADPQFTFRAVAT